MEEAALTPTELAALVTRLADCDVRTSDSALIDLIGGLERVKNAAAALQARATGELRRVREAEAARVGRTVRRVAPAVAAEIALARHESPHRGAILVGLATMLNRELPHTMRLFQAGELSEWRASLVVRETACLTREDRATVDAELATQLAKLSDRQIVAECRRISYRLDPHSVVNRVAQAEADRRVTIRPAPDCMAHISALLPVAQGVAVFGALKAAADTAHAAGDTRTRGQVMADTLVERTTGQADAAAVPVEVQIVITDEALLSDSVTPARLEGYGPIPAGIARRLASLGAANDQLWVRRLYANPGSGRLVAMESKKRLFPKGLQRLIKARDEICRTPWCGAPIRHTDHIVPVRAGGATTADNGQGLCERCNQVKEAPGWRSTMTAGSIAISTPTDHEYVSRPPPLPTEDEPPNEAQWLLAPEPLLEETATGPPELTVGHNSAA